MQNMMTHKNSWDAKLVKPIWNILSCIYVSEF